MKRQVKRVQLLTPPEEYRDDLVEIVSGNVICTILWAPDGNLYHVQDGKWYRLEVTDV